MKARKKWPGLVFFCGEGVFRTAGYFVLVLAGIGICQRDPFWVVLCELGFGHICCVTAEVIAQMKEESKRATLGRYQPTGKGGEL